MPECPGGYWGDKKRCKKCYSSCKSCLGSRSDQCMTCKSGYHLNEEKNNCVTSCEDGYYLYHGKNDATMSIRLKSKCVTCVLKKKKTVRNHRLHITHYTLIKKGFPCWKIQHCWSQVWGTNNYFRGPGWDAGCWFYKITLVQNPAPHSCLFYVWHKKNKQKKT